MEKKESSHRAQHLNDIKAERTQATTTLTSKMPKDQVKNYHSDRCGQCFTNKANKYRHKVARHNLHGGPTILNCSQCATTFKRLSDMIRHKAKYHVQSSTPLSDIPRNRDHPTTSSLGDYTIPKKKKESHAVLYSIPSPGHTLP